MVALLTAHPSTYACPPTLQQALLLMQAAIPQLVGACLVLATRYGLDLPQPVLDSQALADLITVPIGQCF